MGKVQFRGICGAVRRAIHNGSLVGEIRPDIVRTLLPEEKKAAPNRTILTSLRRLADLNEITEDRSRFFTKSMTATPLSDPQVSIIGTLLSVKVVAGESIATIKVVEMENV